MESPPFLSLSPLPSPAKNPEQNPSFFPADHFSSQLFLVFFGMIILYLIIKCKGKFHANNEDIERGNPVGDQSPHSNIFLQYFHNRHLRFYHGQNLLIEMNRISEESKSQLILELLEKFQEQWQPSKDKDFSPKEMECAICLDIYEDDDKSWILPRCKHVFHDTCIREWLKSLGSTCPICRTVIFFV